MIPLHWAVRGNALSCAEWLLSKGADVDAETEAHRTPMHRAAEWNLGEMMWLLADCGARGARLDPADSNGRPDDNVRLAVPLAASLTSSANLLDGIEPRMRLLACVSFRTVPVFLSFLWFHDPPRRIHALMCSI